MMFKCQRQCALELNLTLGALSSLTGSLVGHEELKSLINIFDIVNDGKAALLLTFIFGSFANAFWPVRSDLILLRLFLVWANSTT
jgi:hypothetical protein